jgi:hypothetical protein
VGPPAEAKARPIGVASARPTQENATAMSVETMVQKTKIPATSIAPDGTRGRVTANVSGE